MGYVPLRHTVSWVRSFLLPAVARIYIERKESVMERGLLWLPLLGFFIWLAWAGWNEYQKVQAYEAWAADFDRSKYDVRAVLGQSGDFLTWGIPTRQGPVNVVSVSLADVETLGLAVRDQELAPEADLPDERAADLVVTLKSGEVYKIPFTNGTLAQRWKKALHQSLQALKSAST